MIKKIIKKEIKKTGMYRALELENKRLEDKNNSLKKESDALREHINRIHNEKLDLKRLINNLKNENNSLKEIFLDLDVPLSSDYNKLTVIVPYREAGDPDRVENINITLDYLSQIGIKNLILSEHSINSDTSLKETYEDLFISFKHIFNKADDDVFNKSHAINQAVKETNTPYFAIVDIDCIAPKLNFDQALYLLDKGFEIVHPFNRIIKDITHKEQFKEDYDFEKIDSPPQYRDWADGGIVFWNKDSFISIGMKNEYFSGWGGEDNEILIRANLCQLKHIRINDVLYHLYHDRPQIRNRNNVEETQRIERIKSKEELFKEIEGWCWIFEEIK